MVWAKIAAAFMFLAVALGAFGAHALKNKLSADMLVIFETGVRYQVYHALALLFLTWLAVTRPATAVSVAGWAFTVGIVIFSGSLYVLTLTGVRAWGAVTPIGGLAFLVAWAAMLISLFRSH
jgi:uncharacterized membrane protein YgdD (TMEM256/DUF423 family)